MLLNNWRQNLLPFVAVAILMPLVWGMLELLFWPEYQQSLITQERQLNQLESQQKALNQLTNDRQVLSAAWQVQEQQFVSMRSRVDIHCDSSCVVNSLTLAAEQAAITIDVFEWQAQEQTSNWIITPFYLVLRGDFIRVLDFFQQLDNSLFFIVFDRFDLHRAEPNGTQIELIAQASLMHPQFQEEPSE